MECTLDHITHDRMCMSAHVVLPRDPKMVALNGKPVSPELLCEFFVFYGSMWLLAVI